MYYDSPKGVSMRKTILILMLLFVICSSVFSYEYTMYLGGITEDGNFKIHLSDSDIMDQFYLTTLDTESVLFILDSKKYHKIENLFLISDFVHEGYDECVVRLVNVSRGVESTVFYVESRKSGSAGFSFLMTDEKVRNLLDSIIESILDDKVLILDVYSDDINKEVLSFDKKVERLFFRVNIDDLSQINKEYNLFKSYYYSSFK